MSNLKSRIERLENRRADPGVPRNDAGVAAYAESNFDIAPGVLDRAKEAGHDLIAQCRSESAEFRAWDDKLTYRDKNGRPYAHLVCEYDPAPPIRD